MFFPEIFFADVYVDKWYSDDDEKREENAENGEWYHSFFSIVFQYNYFTISFLSVSVITQIICHPTTSFVDDIANINLRLGRIFW